MRARERAREGLGTAEAFDAYRLIEAVAKKVADLVQLCAECGEAALGPVLKQ